MESLKSHHKSINYAYAVRLSANILNSFQHGIQHHETKTVWAYCKTEIILKYAEL
jgi:hypothetical protein